MSHDDPTTSPGPRPAAPGPADGRAVGILGGTFDPVHIGHLRIALDALELLDLAEVRLVPLAHAVHRNQPETPAELRLAMLQAATAGHRMLVADDTELRRDGPSYTVDTLRSLHAELPGRDLCLLLGDDAFAGFPGWREPETILQLASIAVLRRPDDSDPFSGAAGELLRARQVATLRPGVAGQVRLLGVTQLDIASSAIRNRLREGRSIDFLVPDAVLALINRHALYR
ncbi:MAG: nicotinate-nucleotide adenylyltransferase [Gammaproteobacteria bacterium]|nr:nicotinate-nucleotide adenylyltransferase [Gammaproteobacteria bacterium]